MRTCERRVFGRRSDDGIAMFGVLAVTAVAGIFAMTAMFATSSSLRRTDRSEHREQAVHLADAAVARAFAAIVDDSTYATTAVVPPVPVTRDWVLAQAATAPLETAREGEYAWVVPAGADVVFGVGYIPTRAAPRLTRVVQVDARLLRPLGSFSLITSGSLLVEGSPDISGGVHTNGNLTLSGTPYIEGDATAAGTYTAPVDAEVLGQTGGGFEPLPIPAVDPRAYRHAATRDLCPDGAVRTVAPSPCTGTIVGYGTGGGFGGWKWQTGEWSASGNSVTPGVFYVYRANVKLTGNLGPWNATILIEGETVNGQLINGDLDVAGNIELTGDVQVEGSTQQVAFIVARDVKINGNGVFRGLIHAGEQMDIAGNSEIVGQAIAAGTTSSPGSPIGSNRLHGNPRMTEHNHGPSLTASIDATRWEELPG